MDIAAWLRDLGLDRYTPAFLENDIDAAFLPARIGDDIERLGVTSVGHRCSTRMPPVGNAPSSGNCVPRATCSRTWDDLPGRKR